MTVKASRLTNTALKGGLAESLSLLSPHSIDTATSKPLGKPARLVRVLRTSLAKQVSWRIDRAKQTTWV